MQMQETCALISLSGGSLQPAKKLGAQRGGLSVVLGLSLVLSFGLGAFAQDSDSKAAPTPAGGPSPRAQGLVAALKSAADRCERVSLARQINAEAPAFDWSREKKFAQYLVNEIEEYCKSDQPIEEEEMDRLKCDLALLGEVGGAEELQVLTSCAKGVSYFVRKRYIQEQVVDWDYTHSRTSRFKQQMEGDTLYEADLAIQRILERNRAIPKPRVL